MAKEITLDELVSSVNNEKNITDSEPDQDTSNINMGANVGGQTITASELGSKLRKAHNITDTNEQVEQAPLVQNAFSSMYSTIAEKKEKIDKEVVPIIEENAREMAMAKEMGQDIDNEYMDERTDTEETANFSDDVILDEPKTVSYTHLTLPTKRIV